MIWEMKILFILQTSVQCVIQAVHPTLFPPSRVFLQHRWLTPVILATQEAEIRTITVQTQPQHSPQDPISKIPITKRAGKVTQGEDPEFKPQYCKKRKNF
jgi:hypothetical protein